MTNFRISFNPQLQRWKISPSQGGDRVLAARVVLDAPAKTDGAFLVARDCVLSTDGIENLDGQTLIKTAYLRRVNALPGVPPLHDPQLEWCALFHQASDKWYIYRQDNEKIVVGTKNLEMDCHAITVKGVWHCHAEQLLNGQTNKDKVMMNAKWIKLRTLKVYDQIIQVQGISMSPKARAPGLS